MIFYLLILYGYFFLGVVLVFYTVIFFFLNILSIFRHDGQRVRKKMLFLGGATLLWGLFLYVVSGVPFDKETPHLGRNVAINIYGVSASFDLSKFPNECAANIIGKDIMMLYGEWDFSGVNGRLKCLGGDYVLMQLMPSAANWIRIAFDKSRPLSNIATSSCSVGLPSAYESNKEFSCGEYFDADFKRRYNLGEMPSANVGKIVFFSDVDHQLVYVDIFRNNNYDNYAFVVYRSIHNDHVMLSYKFRSEYLSYNDLKEIDKKVVAYIRGFAKVKY